MFVLCVDVHARFGGRGEIIEQFGRGRVGPALLRRRTIQREEDFALRRRVTFDVVFPLVSAFDENSEFRRNSVVRLVLGNEV